MRRVFCAVVLFTLSLPAAVFAQASIAGTVKDTSGAVLPGVTVEASSPALIEKTRSVVADGTGQYKIVDLRPGTYSVTFTLTGFNTIKRDGIELTGTFVASVNAEMRVGAVEETITVTGDTPIVDVQSARQQAVINKDVLDSIPTGRSHNQMVALVPGMTVATQDVGGSSGQGNVGSGQIHGSTSQDGRLQTDGLTVGYNGGSANMYVSNASAAREIVVNTAGGLGEVETGGVVVNIVPRDGGNTFTGTLFANYAGSSFASSNVTSDLKTAGLPPGQTTGGFLAPNTIKKIYDFNPMFGGPIVKDRLWFFATSRTVSATNYVSLFTNANAGNPAAFAYVPTTTQGTTDNKVVTGTIRLTAQAGRNKFNTYFDDQDRCVACIGGGSAFTSAALTAVEANPRQNTLPTYVAQATWQLPLTNRLLLEAGWSVYSQRWGQRPRTDSAFNPTMVNMVEQCTAGCAANGGIAGLIYRQPTAYSHNWEAQQAWRVSASYVTGSHNVKVGYQGGHDEPTVNNQTFTGFSSFRVNNGKPNQVGLTLGAAYGTLMQPTSLYAQDSWTRSRLTLQGGLRYDHLKNTFTGGDRADAPSILPPTLGTPTFISAPIVINGPGFTYDDVTGRYAVTYDLFGDGKTAIKASLGKYVAAPTGSTPLNPIARAGTSASRTWTDNGDFVPQCDFSNPAANGECAASNNPAFGTSVLNATFNTDFFNGWGHRPYEWDFSTSVQQQLTKGVAVNIGYFRRWFGNFAVTNNRAVTAADFTPFSVTAPVDSRLPGGGGYVVDNLYNVVSSKFSAIDNYITSSDDLGYMMMHWNGVDVTFNGRWRSVVWQGGTSTGRTSWDSCAVRAAFPGFTTAGNVTAGVSAADVGAVSPTNPYCSGNQNWLTQVKGLASYVVPVVDVNIAATFQSVPNFNGAGLASGYPGLAANWNVTAAQTTLGRGFAGNLPNLSVNLIQPGTVYGDRTNQLDLRFAKLLRFGRTKTQVALDIYNVTNANPVQSYNQTFIPGGAYLVPNSILQARFAKIGVQFDF